MMVAGLLCQMRRGESSSLVIAALGWAITAGRQPSTSISIRAALREKRPSPIYPGGGGVCPLFVGWTPSWRGGKVHLSQEAIDAADAQVQAELDLHHLG